MACLESEVSKMIEKIWRYIKIIMTFLMLFYVLYIIFVFTYYPKKMQAFCDSTTIGESIEGLKEKADTNNFRYSEDIQSKGLIVYDIKTIGTSTCFISYTDNGQVSKKSYRND